MKQYIPRLKTEQLKKTELPFRHIEKTKIALPAQFAFREEDGPSAPIHLEPLLAALPPFLPAGGAAVDEVGGLRSSAVTATNDPPSLVCSFLAKSLEIFMSAARTTSRAYGSDLLSSSCYMTAFILSLFLSEAVPRFSFPHMRRASWIFAPL